MTESNLYKASAILVLIVSFIMLLFQAKVCLAKDYTKWLDACEPYKDKVFEILSKEGVSTNYYYLMVAESKCRENAVSKAGARGFWQLMPGTSNRFGCDNPDDIECATHAASKYIKSLESRFNTFEDVIIAYNMGGHNYKKYGKSNQALGLVYRVKAIRRADK